MSTSMNLKIFFRKIELFGRQLKLLFFSNLKKVGTTLFIETHILLCKSELDISLGYILG